MASKKDNSAWCAAPNCSNSRKKGWRMFKFPKEEERCRKWVINCRREDLLKKEISYLNRNCFMCSRHFEDNQFMNADRKKLIWKAMPTLFDVSNPPASVTTKRKHPAERQASQPKRTRTSRWLSLSLATKEIDVPMDSSTIAEDRPSSNDSLDSSVVGFSKSPKLPPSKASLSPNKTKMKRRIKTLCQKYRRHNNSNLKKMKGRSLNVRPETQKQKKERVIAELRDLLPRPTWSFISTQIRVGTLKSKGLRWTSSEKAVALALLHASPKAYKILRKNLCLPSVTTLRRAMQNIRIFPGFNDNILEALRQKVSSLPNKLCVLAFDEMALKEEVTYNVERDEVEGFEDFGHTRSQYIANHATVFMARGLLQEWKQAVGYCLSSGPIKATILKPLVEECLQKLVDIGLDVKVVICDQGTNNRSALAGLGVSEEAPYFMQNGKKIYVLYDPPHLLKNMRNNLKKTGFRINNKNISWEYIKEFYYHDSQKSIRMAPKLSQKHITLPTFARLRVKYAAQILSHSVAAGIFTMVELNAMSQEASETAIFAETMDQLFNTFNSRKLRSKQKMRGALTEVSGHKEFLLSTLDWLDSLKSGSTRKLPCLSGWMMAIRNLLALWQNLHANHNVKFLLTHRLNQDCVENLFSVIRGKGGHGDNPSPKQFRLFLRQVMVDSLLTKSDHSNCHEDGDKFILTLSELTASKSNTTIVTPFEDQPLAPQQQADETRDIFQLPFSMSSSISLHEKNVCIYIAGYIARKLQQSACSLCKNMLVGPLTGSKNEILLKNKELSDLKGPGLVVPSRELSDVVEVLETVFQQSGALLYTDKVRARLLRRLEEAVESSGSLSCPSGSCHLLNQTVKLFTNIRIHFVLKDTNMKNAADSKRQNRKMLKLAHL